MNLNFPLPFQVDELVTHMLDTYGINPTNLYCSVTGRPYAIVPDHELEDTIRFLDDDDLESFADDLFVRIIAGMRPCLNWSRVEPVSIEFARHNDKAGLLAYLVHRANESKPSMDATFGEIMERNQLRIKTYQRIYTLVNEVDTHELVQLLLQADSFGNLHRFRAPMFKQKGFVDPVYLFHLDNLVADKYQWLVESTRTWAEQILEQIESESRVAMADARFAATQGNRLTAQAYTRSWMERPVSALTYDARKRKEDKASGKTERLTKKVRAQAEIDDLFAQVAKALTGPDLAKKIAATPKPAVKPILRFGPKKVEA